MSNQVDLLNLFQAVTSTLSENKEDLNQADHYNNDHGDHMVKIFEVITGAVENTSSAEISQGFSKASKLLDGMDSGSAEMYSKGLSQAADYFQEKEFDASEILPLIQTMLGGGKADIKKGAGGMLDSLVDSFAGEDGLDMGDVLRAGSAFLKSKEEGDSNLEAAVDAIISASAMGEEPYRAKSSQLVANTLLNTLTDTLK